MKLASYKSTRPGVQGIFNRLIRWRYDGPHSHSEIVFEPGDGCDMVMPDGACAPDADGALWCASSVAWERLPAISTRRPGHRGGVRFKRVVLDPEKWDVVDLWADPGHAAGWFLTHQGEPYSWRLIAKALAWFVGLKRNQQWVCSQSCAESLGMADSWRFDPTLLQLVVKDRQHA